MAVFFGATLAALLAILFVRSLVSRLRDAGDGYPATPAELGLAAAVLPVVDSVADAAEAVVEVVADAAGAAVEAVAGAASAVADAVLPSAERVTTETESSPPGV